MSKIAKNLTFFKNIVIFLAIFFLKKLILAIF